MSIAIFIAVRLNSKRLNEKALAKIGRDELIIHLTNRLKKSKKVKRIIWCTSNLKSDDKLCKLAKENNIDFFRGDEKNVLIRFINAAEKFQIDNIVRVTGDNPLTDPLIMDNMIVSHYKKKADYTFCEDMPIGTSSEIVNIKTLKYCQENLQDPSCSEYMTWILKRPDKFKINKHIPKGLKYINQNFSYTVDTKAGLKLIKNIYHYYDGFPSLKKIISDFNYEKKDKFLSKLSSSHNFNFYFKNEDRNRFPVVAIIQARSNSSRLPDKINKLILGKKMIFHVLERVGRATSIDNIVVALTNEQNDDKIASECIKKGYPLFRGSSLDVLSRYYFAAKKFKAKTIVRITSDSPLIDPDLINEIVYSFINIKNKKIKYASNRLERSYPIGTDVEVFSYELLEKTHINAKKNYHREHVTPYMYEEVNKKHLLSIKYKKKYNDIRLTVDTYQDLKLIKKIYRHFGLKLSFSWKDVIKFLEINPLLKKLNQDVKQKKFFHIDSSWDN